MVSRYSLGREAGRDPHFSEPFLRDGFHLEQCLLSVGVAGQPGLEGNHDIPVRYTHELAVKGHALPDLR